MVAEDGRRNVQLRSTGGNLAMHLYTAKDEGIMSEEDSVFVP